MLRGYRLVAIAIVLIGGILSADVLSEKQIRPQPPGAMNRETIEIEEIKPNYFKVTVNYWFEGDINHFFPLAFPETERVRLIDFTATAGGEPLRVERKIAPEKGAFSFRGQRYPVLYKLSAARKIPVQNGETHSSNQYFFNAPEFLTKGDVQKYRLIEYVLVTGAGWTTGTIGDLTLAVSFLSDRCRCALPLNNFSTGRCIAPRKFRLHVRGWKPDQNFELAIPAQCAERN